MFSTPARTDRGPGGLDDFHHFREKKFNFLYFCKKCARSYDSISAMEKCKFCASPLTEMQAKQQHPLLTEKYYRYHCASCERSFKSPVKHSECQICGSRIISFYRWEDIPLKDKLALRFFRIVRTKKEDEGREVKHGKGEDGKEALEKGVTAIILKAKLPILQALTERIKNMKNAKPSSVKIRLPGFFRKAPKEEMPTF